MITSLVLLSLSTYKSILYVFADICQHEEDSTRVSMRVLNYLILSKHFLISEYIDREVNVFNSPVEPNVARRPAS